MTEHTPHAFVTGGTRGIGFAIAKTLARKGYRVTVCGASAESVASCRETVVEEGLPIEALQLDVRDDELLHCGISRAASSAGRLDVLVACAGAPTSGSAVTLPMEDWNKCLNLNLGAYFAAAKAAVREMRDGGSIVLISSIWALTAIRDRVAYVTAKTALSGLARALAVDHAPAGIRTNCVAPGYIDTALLRTSLTAWGAADSDAELSKLERQHPLGRLVTMEDVANTVAFLAGKDSSGITGQTIVVDGGVTIRFALPGD